MKKYLILPVLCLAMISCKKEVKNEVTPEEEKAVIEETSQAVSYNVVTDASQVAWEGFKPTESHKGIISGVTGTFAVNEGAIESGKFELDMNTITVTDLEAGNGKESLEAHLKGLEADGKDDFFNVTEFPTATFEVTGVEAKDGKTMLSGNFTMKGHTNNISFPISLTEDENSVQLTSEVFTINRIDWNVQFMSKTIFSDLKDKFIKDEIELQIDIKATK